MSMTEGTDVRVAYKFYASGSMAANTEADTASAPGASSGQILRRVANTLALQKRTFRSAEVRTDGQRPVPRHSGVIASGELTGELSPGTWFPFFEAVLRDTATAGVVLDETDLTSVTADSGTSKFTFAGGDPVALGLGVGMTFRFANLSTTANNAQNFTILSFGGTSNREVTVTPAPTTMGSDSAFTLTVPGKTTIVPATGRQKRLLAVENYDEAQDLAELFTEGRLSGFGINAGADGAVTVRFPITARNLKLFSGGSAPYFTSPGAVGVTPQGTAVNGLCMVGGTSLGTVTAFELQAEMTVDAQNVQGQQFVPEIFLRPITFSGSVTALFNGTSLYNSFVNEEQKDILFSVASSSAADADLVSFFLPALVLGGHNKPVQGEGGQIVTIPFECGIYTGSTAGVPASSIRIHDTAA